ncbi:hypothetical protein Hdeb2414_s0003g00086631 [Helianthus debilis subsp. tardiflorus]
MIMLSIFKWNICGSQIKIKVNSNLKNKQLPMIFRSSGGRIGFFLRGAASTST